MLLTLLAAIASFGAGAVLFYFVGRRAGRGTRGLAESRMRRVERDASRVLFERLRVLRREVGELYFGGVQFSESREVTRAFDAGVRAAARGDWRTAHRSWSDARRSARGTEAAGLDFLLAAVELLRGRHGEAAELAGAALKAVEQDHDPAGAAACSNLLGIAARRRGDHRGAKGHFLRSAEAAATAGDRLAEARALAGAAGLADRLDGPEQALEQHRRACQALEKAGDAASAAAEYGRIGELLAALGRIDEARAAHEDGLQLARQARSRTAEADRLLAIGDIHVRQGNYKRAWEVLNRALKHYRDTGGRAGQLQALHRLALAHRSAGEMEVAQEFFEQTLALARRTEDRLMQARSLEGMAEGYASHGAYDRALALFREALDEDRRRGDAADADRGIRSVHLAGMGRILLARGDHRGALACFEEALELARGSSDPMAIAARSVEVARAKRGLGDYAAALELLAKAGGGIRETAETGLRASLHAETGLNLLARDEVAGAADELQSAARLHRSAGAGRELGRDLVNLGKVLSRKGDTEAAVRSITDGLQHLRRKGTRTEQAWGLAVLADVRSERGDAAGAERDLKDALELAREAHDLRREADCLVRLGRLKATRGDAAEARALLRRAATAFDRLGDGAAARELGEELGRLPIPDTGVQFIDREPGDGPKSTVD